MSRLIISLYQEALVVGMVVVVLVVVVLGIIIQVKVWHLYHMVGVKSNHVCD
jgi:hypothetical protein